MRAAYRRGTIDDLLKPENKTPRLRELEKKFDELIVKQRSVLVKNEFDRIYTTAGGSGMNAFTNEDMTGYFITVPANKVELWMWMESERLLRPVFREFYAERDVVFEERRLRTEATPLGKYEETFESMFWESHRRTPITRPTTRRRTSRWFSSAISIPSRSPRRRRSTSAGSRGGKTRCPTS
jgi:predicted Zn-dependent peptidase